MSNEWLPVLVVLAVGSLAGLAVAWWMRRRDGSADSQPDLADARLRLQDLERRKRELYERLERDDGVADRAQLEDQAARVLRDIDRLRGEQPAEVAAAADAATPVPPAASVAATGRPMLVGFLGGAAMVAVVALLVFWAGEDAKPRESTGMEASATVGGSEHPSPALTADVAARIDGLRERAAANPSDLVARKQLSLALLAAEQYFEAFEVAQEIRASRPDDPDALYVQGMVRMTMGQDEQALELLDAVLEQYPNHVLALAGRGMVFMRAGDRDAAILVWERALEAAGGSHPDLEGLLEMARSSPPTMPATSAEGGSPTSFEPMPGVPAAAPAAPADSSVAVSADAFGVEIHLEPGATAPPGAILFVFLRQAAEGPPAAVKRIQAPVFPLRVELGPQDSMLGRELPESGVITVRLDADGSASTQGAGDLAAAGEARLGESIRLSLGS